MYSRWPVSAKKLRFSVLRALEPRTCLQNDRGRQRRRSKREKTCKTTTNATKWAFKVFSEPQISRNNKDPSQEQCSGLQGQRSLNSLGLNIANKNVDSLKFWLKKFVQDIVKADGSPYPERVCEMKMKHYIMPIVALCNALCSFAFQDSSIYPAITLAPR